VAQFSDDNERPLLSVLLNPSPAGGTRCVECAISHILLRDFFDGVDRSSIYGVEVALKSVNVIGPESAAPIQPGIDALKQSLGFLFAAVGDNHASILMKRSPQYFANWVS
jgi:hypothetical protein